MTRLLPLPAVLCAALAASACGSAETPEPPVATATVRLNHERAPAGSPLDITYTFVVAEGATINGTHRVFLHVVDTDEERMWTDDHDPPMPTSEWRPGQTIEYTRTVFIPIFPYVGDATMQLGLYSTADNSRLPLAGEDIGQRAYRAARLHLLPQTENLFTLFKEGWHPAEVDQANSTVEWQWTKRDATLAFRNPKKPAVFYLDVDSPRDDLHGPQAVKVSIGGKPVDEFTLASNQRQLRKAAVTPELLGDSEMAEIQISVDKTFTPGLISSSGSKDPRELGVRVFHAFVDPR